jgi:Glutaminase
MSVHVYTCLYKMRRWGNSVTETTGLSLGKLHKFATAICSLGLGVAFMLLMPIVEAKAVSSGDFKVTAPSHWQKVPTSFDGQLFRNSASKTNQTVLIYTRETGDHSVLSADQLVNLAPSLARIRQQELESVGILDYSLNSAEALPDRKKPGVEILKIESRYLSVTHQVVNSVELQYFAGNRVYAVVYTEESPSLGDRQRIDNILLQFDPQIPKSRFPASTAETKGGHGFTLTPDDEPVNGLNPHHFSAVGFKKQNGQCAGVPVGVRRSESDDQQTGGEALKSVAMGCYGHFKQEYGPLIEKLFSFFTQSNSQGKGFWSGVKDSVSSGANAAVQYVEDGRFRQTTNAAWAAVTEVAKHPVEAFNNVTTGIAQYFKADFQVPFDCLNSAAQGAVVCKTIEKILNAATVATGATAGAGLLAMGLIKGSRVAGEGLALMKSIGESAYAEVAAARASSAAGRAIAGIEGAKAPVTSMDVALALAGADKKLAEKAPAVVNSAKAAKGAVTGDNMAKSGLANAGIANDEALSDEAVSVKNAIPAFDRKAYSDLEKSAFHSAEQNLFTVPRGTQQEAALANEKVIGDLNRWPQPKGTKDRLPGLNDSQVNALYRKVENNKVASVCSVDKYDPENKGIGFCFGRATTAHIEALRAGIDKDQIRKVWAVGNFKTGMGSWRYHVATIVRGENGNWMAIDPIFGRPLTVEEWYSSMKKYEDPLDTRNMRMFTTEAKRFGPMTGNKYSPASLKTGPGPDPDFNSYFRDLMDTFKDEIKSLPRRRNVPLEE